MKQGLSKFNDDIIAGKIEYRMDLISEGELTASEASKTLDEIQVLIGQMEPEARETQQMYFDMFKDRVARCYLHNGGIIRQM